MASSAIFAPPRPANDGLRLLCLDGGGIRGLSELILLEAIMRSINPESPPRPCDVFDLICGSSSGGLIAIMLGRLRMTVEECINAYIQFQQLVFQKAIARFLPIDIRGRLKPRYSHESLENAIKEIILSRGLDRNELLLEANLHSAVTVVVARRVVDSHVELFSSYHSSRLTEDQNIRVWEAARATSAAPTFFDPVAVGPYQIKYVDGGMGANNPVYHTVQVAKDIWPETNIACLVSIGSGRAQFLSVPTQLLDMTKYLVAIATDTEQTAETFARSNRDMAVTDRYFRFNVNQGMEHIGSDEWNAVESIVSATKRYCEAVETEISIERCAEKLRRDNRFILGVPEIEMISTAADPQMRVSNQPLLEQPQERTPSIDAASASQPEGFSTHENAPGADSNLDVDTSVRGQKGLPQVADSGPSTGQDGQDQSQATHTGPEFFKEEDILIKNIAKCILADIEMQSLILTAYDKVGDFRLKKNLAILLEDFAQRLSIEKLFGHLPNFIGLRAPEVMDRVLMALPADTSTSRTATLPSYEDVISVRDEVQDLGEVKRNFQTLNQLQIKAIHDLFNGPAVKQSTPFRQLSDDLRRFVFPSTKSYVKEIIGPYLRHTKLVPIYSIVVRVHWELRKFLIQEPEVANDISDMITLTGTLTQAQALTCGAYMRQTWPQSGLQTLEAVKHVLNNEKSYYQHGPTHSIELEYPDEHLIAQINGLPQEIIETIEQFAWLSSVFRFSTKQSPGLSETEFRVSPTKQWLGLSEIEFQVVPGPTGSKSVFAELLLRPIRNVPESDLSFGSCWIPLFDHSVLAWGFPIAERGDLYGLELPFELLLKASRARFPVEFQNSVIIRQGPLTAFPVASRPVGTQWHATYGGLDEFFDKINSIPLLPVQDDIKAILNGRHFLGWLTRAQVKLGTERPSNQTSGANMETNRGLQLGEEIPATLSIRPPWVGVNIGARFVIPRAQMQRFQNDQMDFEQLLQRSASTAALYYDCSTGTGWVVPELSLLFHVVCAHLLRHRADSDALYDIGYAQLLSDGGDAALAAIRSCNTTVLWEFQGRGETYYFRDLVQFYLDCFENRKEAIRLRLEHNELLADLGLRGWDFGDLRDCTAFFRSRLISPPYLSGRPDWWSLTKNPNLMVVFGGNLGQVIIPDRAEQRPCSSWTEIPPGYNLLVCLVRCMEEMCRPWEARLPQMQLSETLCWHQPENSRPFGDCLGRGCNPIQKLRDISGWNPFHGLRNPDGISRDGAIIFGLPNDGIRHIGLQLQPCRPLEAIVPAPAQTNHLRTRPTEIPQKWIFNLSRAATKLRRYKAHFVSLTAGMIMVCGYFLIVMNRRRP